MKLNPEACMSSKERFLTALIGGIPDRVPVFNFPFRQKLQEIVIGYRTGLYEGTAIVKMANVLGLDGVPYISWRLLRY